MKRSAMIGAVVVSVLSAIVLAQDAGKFTDPRDGKTYKKVTIGKQVWMAENLNYAAIGSVCYNNKESSCVQYGRLYTWSAAKTACPAGWHLPSDTEWTALTDFVGGSETAGKKLKSASGWNENANGTNDFGFSALPGGYGYSDGNFYNAGYSGYWWSATEGGASDAWYRDMYCDVEYVYRSIYGKAYLLSVRCVLD